MAYAQLTSTSGGYILSISAAQAFQWHFVPLGMTGLTFSDFVEPLLQGDEALWGFFASLGSCLESFETAGTPFGRTLRLRINIVVD